MSLRYTLKTLIQQKAAKILPLVKHFPGLGNQNLRITSCPCGANIQAVVKALQKILVQVIYLYLHNSFFIQEIFSESLSVFCFNFWNVPVIGLYKVLLESSGIRIQFAMEGWPIIMEGFSETGCLGSASQERCFIKQREKVRERGRERVHGMETT